MSKDLAALRQDAFGGGPRRLHQVIELAREMGRCGMAYHDALDVTEDCIWAAGALPADTPWQRRAWEICLRGARAAFYEGSREVVRLHARRAVAATAGSPYAALYITAFHSCLLVYSDDDIVDAVREALAKVGYPSLPNASPLYPIKRARLAHSLGDRAELESLYQSDEGMALAAFVDDGERIHSIYFPGHDCQTPPPDDDCRRDASDEVADSRHEREASASADREEPLIKTGTAGSPAGLRLVVANGEAAAPAEQSLASDIQTLEHRALEQGDQRLAARLRRERLGLNCRADEAPQPVDLWQRHEAPVLPLDCLPIAIERFAFEQGELMGADPAGIAMSALAVCAAAVPDSIELQVKQHDPSWRENARLWVGLVGMPSTKKSPVMRAAMRPLRAIDQEMAIRNAIAAQTWGAVPKKDQSEPQPKQPRLVVQDSTIEALQETLKDSPLGVLSFQDELTGWFGAMEKYAGGKGAKADRGFWLQAFNGGPYAVNRIARGTLLIPNLGVGILGGIQPEPLRAIAGDMDDDGLLQRFLPVILRPATVGRDAPAGDGANAYERLVERLHGFRPPCGAGNLENSRPVVMSAEARVCREALEAEHVELVRALEIASPKLAGHLGKADGIFARLCLLWACIEADGPTAPAEISGEVADRVARFMKEFLRPSAVAFYAGVLGMSAGHDDLMSIANLIVSEGLEEVDARIVQRSGQRFRSVAADEVRRLCEKLEAFAWLSPVAVAKGASPKWRVAPAVHDIFADRGRAEAERRAKVREVIASTLGAK